MINISMDQGSIDFGEIKILAIHPDDWNGPNCPILGQTLKPYFEGKFLMFKFSGIKK
jgi:hypothetical protein